MYKTLKNVIDKKKSKCVNKIWKLSLELYEIFKILIIDYPTDIPLKHYQFDICDENELKKALNSVTTVFHCAGKSLEYLHDGTNHTDQYWHDNTNGITNIYKLE